jgi:hypothetical protein
VTYWWAVIALATVGVLKAGQGPLTRRYRRWRTRKALYRMAREAHLAPRWEPMEQLDDDNEPHGV